MITHQNLVTPRLYYGFAFLAVANLFSASVSANTDPVAVDDVMTLIRGQTTMTLEGGMTSVLENDTDPDGGILSINLLKRKPVHGALTLNVDGSFTYIHDNSDSLSDYFTYRVCDDGEPAACSDAGVNIFVFPSNDAICSIPGVGIPESGVVSDSLNLAANGGLVDMNIALLIDHDWVGDVIATLNHDGVSVALLDQPGVPVIDAFGCGGRNIDVMLDDEGDSPAEDMCTLSNDPIIFGAATPAGRLSDFKGQDVAGEWRLDVGDNFVDASAGVLQMWCLIPIDEAICSAPNLAIPDNDPVTGVTDSIAVSLAGNISDMDVLVQIDHSWAGDISATVSHNSTDVMLLDRPGVPAIDEFGCGIPNIDAVFDDSDAFAAEDTCSGTEPAISGFFRPSEPLSIFNNQELSGSWSLNITDGSAIDIGTFKQWCLVPAVDPGSFTVNKDFSDDNPVSVSITLSCTTGTVTNNPQFASEASPAVFAIEDYFAGTTCTATEDTTLPQYQIDETGCQDGDAINSSCTVINTLNSGNFTVNKDFSDNNADSVSVSLSCTSGTVTNNPQLASEASPAVFAIEGYVAGTTCTATEDTPLPGYQTDEAGCQDGDVINDSCTIINTLNSGNFTVNKDFSDNNTDSVSISLSCMTGTVTNNPQSASEASPAVFIIEGFTPGTTCTATEVTPPAAYQVNNSGCQDGDAINGSCVIINTLNSGNFTVNKDFSDNNTDSVSISLSCTSGTVTNNPQLASEASPAVFAVEGFIAGTTCTATENTSLLSYQVDETGCQDGDAINGSCTIVNTLNSGNFTVNKDFSDNNTDSVSISLSCTSGTVLNNPQSASEASPAVFNINGFMPGTTCTATEGAPPAAYQVNESGCQDGDAINGSCTIVNTLNSGTFTVNKDFSDNNSDNVSITLGCTAGSVTNNPQIASEATPAEFNIEGFIPGTTCTAFEATPTPGYTVDESNCQSGDPNGGSCTIVNTLVEGTFTVNKNFSDNNTDSVSISLSCTPPGTVTNSPQFASEASPAVFGIEGFSGSTACSANEDSPPSGYTVNQTDCQNGNPDGGSCTIVNTLVAGTFTVNKDFSDNNTDNVSISLECSSGTVTNSPQNASELAAAVFLVNGFNPQTTCSASENTPPAAYQVDDTDCKDDDINTGCTIINTLNSGNFTVNKDFSDGNTESVSISLICTSGTVTNNNPQLASEASPAVFNIEGYTAGATCTATEDTPLPGYQVNQTDCQNGDTINAGCTIVNTLNIGNFTVNKDFSDNNSDSVSINLSCTSGTVTNNPQLASEASPAVFNVEGFVAGTTCTASEGAPPAAYQVDETGCQNGDAINGSCTIINTLNSGNFTVHKDFSDDNSDSVSISLDCTSGTVTNSPQDASESTPAVFAIEGFESGATCTATENVTPPAYTVDETNCQSGDPNGGSCTIVNVLNKGEFTVNKDFSDDSIESVSVSLSCTSGTVTNNPQSASEASPAVFNVEGYTAGATCTANEVTPPAAYQVDESGCQDGDAINDSCTIVNTLNNGSFTVHKDFSDDSTDSVSITLSCTSGTVTNNNPQSASEASPAVFAIEGFTDGTTCTATENEPPATYLVDEAGCQDGDAINDSCTIVNTLNSSNFTVYKDFSDNNTGSVSISLSCTSGTVTNSPQNASEFAPAMFLIEGFNPGTTCAATEEAPPAGYQADETGCQDGDPIGDSCTIINTSIDRSEIIFFDGFEN